MKNVLITPDGIQRNLRSFKPIEALCEYIWNGFDAGANIVSIELNKNELGLINMITIQDNGSGIAFEDLEIKFQRFNDSTRLVPGEKINKTLPRGRRGIGRLTFFAFAQRCRWETVYAINDKHFAYHIDMAKDSINQYDDNGGKKPQETTEPTGTKVLFTQIDTIDKDEVVHVLKTQFFWFLELEKKQNYKILVDGEPLVYEDFVEERVKLIVDEDEYTHKYDITLVKWKEKLGTEYSRLYFLDSEGKEKYKETTKLNRQKDQFYHSVFIESDYFDDFCFDTPEIEGQTAIFANKSDDEYKKIIDFINGKLVSYRKKYLKEASEKYISTLVDSKVYPEIDRSTVLGEFKRQQLDDLVGTLYIAQPKIFTGLSDENKKIVLGLLNLIMETGDKPELYKILQQVIDLEEDELKKLSDILRYTSLSNITKTIQLLKDRQEVIQALKEIIFNKEFNAYEVEHVQKIVQSHYWIFGEQYNLISAAEPDFEQALLGLLKASGKKDKKVRIEHEDKNKEMDIFMIKQDRRGNVIENVVVELKRPSVKLGEKQLSQVKQYMRVIKSEDRFNSGDSKWTYYLVGNEFDTSGYIEGELENCRSKGDKHLVYETNSGLTRIYVLKWSELFDELLTRHEYLMDKLKFEEELWIKKHNSADETVEDLSDNSAQMKPAVV